MKPSNEHIAAKLMGSVASPKKIAQAQKNGELGGRPRTKQRRKHASAPDAAETKDTAKG